MAIVQSYLNKYEQGWGAYGSMWPYDNDACDEVGGIAKKA